MVEKGLPGLDKVIVEHKTLSEGRQRYSYHCQMFYVDINIDFHEL